MSFEQSGFLLLAVVTFALWRLVRHQERHAVAVLLAASLIFYGTNHWLLLPILLAVCVVNWAIARSLTTSKYPRGLLAIGVGFNLGLLAFYKYTPLLVTTLWPGYSGIDLQHWSIPYGISFYAFTGIAYMVDVYRRDTPAERSLTRYTLSAAFFPHLVAGPILRPYEFLDRVRPGQLPTEPLDLGEAFWLIARGFFKKLVVADRIGTAIDPFFEHVGDAATAGVWSLPYVWLYALQIFFDFSAYTDLARGFGLLFGYRWPENFNAPYLAVNISEFWRRWHMTLSRFLRDYLYIPLGGNRGRPWRTHFNLMITMLLGGLWHGASWNFLIWGGLHGAFLILHKLWSQSPLAWIFSGRWGRLFAIALTFHAVCLAWCFFRLPRFSDSLDCVRKWFDCDAAKMFAGPWLDPSLGMALLLYLGLITLVGELRTMRRPVLPFARGLAWGWIAGVLLLAILLAPSGVKAAFIYFQF